MSLRARLSLFVFGAISLLTGGVLLGALRRDQIMRETIAELLLAGQTALWDSATERLIDGLAARQATLPQAALAAAVQAHDSAAATALLAGQERDGVRVEVLDAHGRPMLGVRSGVSVLNAGVLAAVLGDGEQATDLDRDATGALLASVAAPIRAPDGPVLGALVLSQPVGPILATLGEASDSELYLLGVRGETLPGSMAALPPELKALATPPRVGVQVADLGERVLRLSTIALPSHTGALLGYELSATDITGAHRRAALLRIAALSAVVLFAAAIQAALYLYLCRAFRPLERALAALTALAAGDATVDVTGEGRKDEVGRLAEAVRLARDHKREEARAGGRAERRRRRQERFIRRQMLELAETLDAPARAALLGDLERIEADAQRQRRPAADGADEGPLGATAIAFRYMSGRVRQQHADLARLVGELREALAAKTELIGLQQHLAIAGRMQASILPAPLPPRRELDIHGTLLPAHEVGGDFYDYFPRPDGRIVIAAGEIAGSGLATAFMMLVARTLLKALQLCGLEPADTLRRMDAMLAAENQQRLAVRLFVALLDPASGRLSYANAGYAAPLLARGAGEVVEVSLADSDALATGESPRTVSGVLDLPVRATLLLASHGAEAAADRFGRALGRDGLIAAVQASDDLGCRALCEAASAAILAIAPDRRAADATCLAVRYLGG